MSRRRAARRWLFQSAPRFSREANRLTSASTECASPFQSAPRFSREANRNLGLAAALIASVSIRASLQPRGEHHFHALALSAVVSIRASLQPRGELKIISTA